MSHPNQPQQSTPINLAPSPGELPGARQNTTPATVNPDSNAPQAGIVTAPPQQVPDAPIFKEPTIPQPQQQEPESKPPQQNSQQKSDEMVEMERFKAVQQIARQNEADARAYRKLLEGLGVQPEQKNEFDPQAEFTKLRNEIEQERAERAREQIAHETNVPVDQIVGNTPEQMKASAERALEWVNGMLQQAKVPAAVPSSVVNSPAGPNEGGPVQIETREQLAAMSPADRMQAMREGRCDKLLGKRQ